MLLDRALTHGDEHVIKFVAIAIDAYEHTGAPDTLAAAHRITALIAPAGQ